METRPIEEALLDPRYVDRSRYALQIEQYLEHFPPHQLFLCRTEQLLDPADSSWHRLLGFIGVDSTWRPATTARANDGEKRMEMRPGARAFRSRVKGSVGYRLVPSAARRAVRQAAARRSTPNDGAIIDDVLHERLTELLADDMSRFEEIRTAFASRTG
jgi:hypothetical protein